MCAEMEREKRYERGRMNISGRKRVLAGCEGHGKTRTRKKLIADHCGTRFILTYFTCAQA